MLAKLERRSRKGFSLIEMLVVISVTVLVGTASYPTLRNLGGLTSQQEAIAKAEALTAAKLAFSRSSDQAADAWLTAESDQERFDHLHPYLKQAGFPQAETSLSAFSADPPYDQFDLGNRLRSIVRVASTN